MRECLSCGGDAHKPYCDVCEEDGSAAAHRREVQGEVMFFALTTRDLGRWVTYESHPGARLERGRIKSFRNEGHAAFVVYGHGASLENWQDYQSQLTPYDNLTLEPLPIDEANDDPDVDDDWSDLEERLDAALSAGDAQDEAKGMIDG